MMTMDPKTHNLPHWDMSVVYPGLDSPEYLRDFEAARLEIKNLVDLFDALAVGGQAALPVNESLVRSFHQVIDGMNQTLEKMHTLQAYIYSFVATNSRDALAQSRMSEFQIEAVKLSQLSTRMTAWIGAIDVGRLLAQSELARSYEYMVRRAKEKAAHLMSPEKEVLVSELDLSSGDAWGRLYNNLSSQIMVSMEQAGQMANLPMSVVRNLAYDRSREVRRRAYEAELVSWEVHAVPQAAALNSIKGETITLCRHRGYASPLDEALFNNGIDRDTLEALLEASRRAYPDFRRYLQAKARLLSLEKLPWYDLFAPVEGRSTSADDAKDSSNLNRPTWYYGEGSQMVIEQFSSYSTRMGDFARRAFRENWIDAEPRSGKRDGAFCMSLHATNHACWPITNPASKASSPWLTSWDMAITTLILPINPY